MFRPADVHAGQREPGAGPRQGGPQDDPGVGRHGRLRPGPGRPVGGNMTPDTSQCVCRGSVTNSAANRLIGEVVQSRRRPLLGPSPG